MDIQISVGHMVNNPSKMSSMNDEAQCNSQGNEKWLTNENKQSFLVDISVLVVYFRLSAMLCQSVALSGLIDWYVYFSIRNFKTAIQLCYDAKEVILEVLTS